MNNDIKRIEELLSQFDRTESAVDVYKSHLEQAKNPSRTPPSITSHYLVRNKPLVIDELKKLIKMLEDEEV